MNHHVMVPYASKEFFQPNNIPGLFHIYYSPGLESIYQKVKRRLGFRDIRNSLEYSLRFVEGDKYLNKTYAMWLSPEFYLPPRLMAALLDRLPGLKWVYSQMTGTDHLDLNAFRERGIIVSNAGELNTRRTAEMALACMLSHAKKLPTHFMMQRLGGGKSLPVDELHRQAVGIIGTGHIGHELARLCRAVGMHVIGASRDPGRFGHDPYPYHRIVRLEGELGLMLKEADHVVLALPLKPETRGLIGARELSTMKKETSLINVARDAIVDESELFEALSKGTIGAAYIDPPNDLSTPKWNGLIRSGKLLLTHNSAANSPYRRKESFEQFVAGLRQMIETGMPPNRVA